MEKAEVGQNLNTTQYGVADKGRDKANAVKNQSVRSREMWPLAVRRSVTDRSEWKLLIG